MVRQPSSGPMPVHPGRGSHPPPDSVPRWHASLHVCGNFAQIAGDQAVAALFQSLLAGCLFQRELGPVHDTGAEFHHHSRGAGQCSLEFSGLVLGHGRQGPWEVTLYLACIYSWDGVGGAQSHGDHLRVIYSGPGISCWTSVSPAAATAPAARPSGPRARGTLWFPQPQFLSTQLVSPGRNCFTNTRLL